MRFFLVLLLLFPIKYSLAGPVVVYQSQEAPANGKVLVNANIYWYDQIERENEDVAPVNGSYTVGPVYSGGDNQWWGGSFDKIKTVECKGVTYSDCRMKWTKKYGASSSVVLQIPSSEIGNEFFCLGIGIGLNQAKNKYLFPGSVCAKVPPANISCSLKFSDNIILDFGDLSPDDYDGRSQEVHSSIDCTGGAASITVMMSEWKIKLNNDTTANVSIYGPNNNVVSADGHFANFHEGSTPVYLKAVLKGRPTRMGAFNGSSVLYMYYD